MEFNHNGKLIFYKFHKLAFRRHKVNFALPLQRINQFLAKIEFDERKFKVASVLLSPFYGLFALFTFVFDTNTDE